MAILFLVSSLTYRDFSVNSHVIIMLVAGVLTGSIGGILGINLRREPKLRSGR